jgi:hypothetical protein
MLGYYYHRHHFNLNSLHLKKMFFTGDAYRSIPFFIRNLSGFTEKKTFQNIHFQLFVTYSILIKPGFNISKTASSVHNTPRRCTDFWASI